MRTVETMSETLQISRIEMRNLDRILQMEGGYVLNFSDRTFAQFFADELRLDIDDSKYSIDGGSKGKRLRHFLQDSPPETASRALRALWAYRRDMLAMSGHITDPVLQAETIMFQIISKLESKVGRASTDALERFTHDETLEELIASIERDIAAHKPQVALDRLHTYCMKKFAHLLVIRGEKPQTNETLNGRAGRYFNPLRKTGKVRPISEKIMKSTVDIFEQFNNIRNNESLAHDNVLIETNEARFIFDAVINLLRFTRSIEGTNYGS